MPKMYTCMIKIKPCHNRKSKLPMLVFIMQRPKTTNLYCHKCTFCYACKVYCRLKSFGCYISWRWTHAPWKLFPNQYYFILWNFLQERTGAHSFFFKSCRQLSFMILNRNLYDVPTLHGYVWINADCWVWNTAL